MKLFLGQVLFYFSNFFEYRNCPFILFNWLSLLALPNTRNSRQYHGSNSSSSAPSFFYSSTHIRPEEFENHNKDGGLWLIIDGKVYDIQDFKYYISCLTIVLPEIVNVCVIFL
jgi:hypothetical protein